MKYYFFLSISNHRLICLFKLIIIYDSLLIINYEQFVPDNLRFDFFFVISSMSDGRALQLTRPDTDLAGSGISNGDDSCDIVCSSEVSEPSIKNRISLLFDKSVGPL